MKTIFSILGFLIFTFSISPALANADSKNLVYNSDFNKLNISGEPIGWSKGGFGNNIRDHKIIPCDFYTETTFVFRPKCPANTKYRLQTNILGVDGDVKWYFDDIKLNKKRDFLMSYQYQAYTYSGMAIARYTLNDGSYSYVLLGSMPQGQGGMGYSSWMYSTIEFTAPKNADSLTIFFASRPPQSDYTCPFPIINGVSNCYSGDQGILSIANVILKYK